MQELLSKCRSGEAGAIEAFVIRVYPWALRYANSMLRDQHLAEDATQEALIIAITRLGDLKHDAALYSWLRQIIRTKVNRILRKRSELPLTGPGLLVSAVPGPQTEVEAQGLRKLVEKSLALLPDKGRVAIELFYLDERSIAEVSRHLGIPVGTVKSRLHDARQRLKEIFFDNGVVPEPLLSRSIGGLCQAWAKLEVL